MKTVYIVILASIACVYLSLKHLDNAYFWDDEAHVGIIAKNFLATGHFTGWDGRNLYALRDGAVLDAHLRTINPPLEYGLTAASFWIFGASTWAGRLPFVVAGLAGLAVFGLLVRHEFGGNPWLWGYALGGLALSPVFLLNIRQCRYYALSLLFSVLTFYLYRLCLRTKRRRYFILLAVTSTLVFYSNHLLGIAFLLAMGAVHLVFHHRDVATRDWRNLTLAAMLFALATVPYALYYHIWDRPDILSVEVWYIRRLKLLWWNLRELNLMGCFPWIAAVGLVYFLFRYRKQQPDVVRIAWEWGALSLGYVCFLALLSPQPTSFATIADVRYLIPVVPFLAGLVGIFLRFVHQRMQIAALALFLLSVTSNLLTLTPFTGEFRWFLPSYIREVHRDYPTSYRAVVNFLEEHAAQDALVFAFPEYTNYPLMFYAGDKLRLCCTLSRHTRLPGEAVARLDAPVFREQHFPDWFIVFGYEPSVLQSLAFFSRPHRQGREVIRFQYDLVDILDVYWADTQRPELPLHSFGPKTDFDQGKDAVYILRRSEAKKVEQNASSPQGWSIQKPSRQPTQASRTTTGDEL